MNYHPHIHTIVLGGGLDDENKWKETAEISSKNKSKNLFLYYLFYFELSIAKIFP